MSHQPAGYPAVSPYVICGNAARTVAFLEAVADGRLLEAHRLSDGSICHAAVAIGDGVVMLGQGPAVSPTMVHLYVPDAVESFRRGLACGATAVQEPQQTFYGDLTAGLCDDDGHQWWLATHVEDVSATELARRWTVERQRRETAA